VSDAEPRPTDDNRRDPRVLLHWLVTDGRPWIGWGFVAAGALLTILGWFGVSGEAIVAKQIPYVISGGIGGVVLAVIGAFFLGTEELRKDGGRLDRLETMVNELHAALLERPDAPPPAPEATSAAPEGNGQAPVRVVAVKGGDTFHLAGCQMAAGKDAEELTVAAAQARGLTPCPLCQPVAETSSA
jgi:hypothetical protein